MKTAFGANEIIDKAVFNQKQVPKGTKLSTHTIVSAIKYPSLWTSNNELDICIDTPMHQIFLEMVKSLIKVIAKWYIFQHKLTKFTGTMKKPMVGIQTLRLDWCKMERFTDTEKMTGGWIAESYLAYARLLPLWYSDIEEMCPTMDTQSMQCLIMSAYICVCHLMTKTTVHTSVVDAYIKVFLSCCHELAPNTEQPCWWKKGNIVSFLNVRDQIDNFGHLRFYWEGNRERRVQSINTLLNNMRKTDSYMCNKMDELHSITAMR